MTLGISLLEKNELREQLDKDVKKFLRHGGHITMCPPSETGDRRVRPRQKKEPDIMEKYGLIQSEKGYAFK